MGKSFPNPQPPKIDFLTYSIYGKRNGQANKNNQHSFHKTSEALATFKIKYKTPIILGILRRKAKANILYFCNLQTISS